MAGAIGDPYGTPPRDQHEMPELSASPMGLCLATPHHISLQREAAMPVSPVPLRSLKMSSLFTKYGSALFLFVFKNECEGYARRLPPRAIKGPNMWSAAGLMGRNRPRPPHAGWTQARRLTAAQRAKLAHTVHFTRPVVRAARKSTPAITSRRLRRLRRAKHNKVRKAMCHIPPAHGHRFHEELLRSDISFLVSSGTRPPVNIGRLASVFAHVLATTAPASRHWRRSAARRYALRRCLPLRQACHRLNPSSPTNGVRFGDASNPGPPAAAAQPAPPQPERRLRILSANLGGIVDAASKKLPKGQRPSNERPRYTKLMEILDREQYEVLLLQETNLIRAKATPNYLGPNYQVWHDPTPQTSGRGVAIALHHSLGNAKLVNFKRGSDLSKTAAGRLLTADLVLATETGSHTLELTTFHTPHGDIIKTDYLDTLEEHLNSRSAAVAPSRCAVTRIVAGDGNGAWQADEHIASGRAIAHTEGGEFRATMDRVLELENQVLPGAFDPRTQYTHKFQKTAGGTATYTRLDYVFSNRDIKAHVRHTTEAEGICIPGVPSTHYWLVTDLPLSALGKALLPDPKLAAFHPPRLKMNLASSEEAQKLAKQVAPTYAGWSADLPAPLRAAYLDRGVLTDASPQAHWEACTASLSSAIAWIRILTVQRMRKALGQPDKTATRRAPPGGARLKKRWSPAEAPDRRAQVWYRKAASAARCVHAHLSNAQTHAPTDGTPLIPPKRARRLDKALLAYHHEIRRIDPSPPPPTIQSLGDQPATVERLCQLDLRTLSAWVKQLGRARAHHALALRELQAQAATLASDRIEREIAMELRRNGTRRARELLMHKRAPQQGIAVLRDDATGKSTADPAKVAALATEYTQRLLGTPPTAAQPTGQPWQAEGIWANCRRKWTQEMTSTVSALATAADITAIIGKASASSAPGLDGVQYNALKLLLSLGKQGGGGAGAELLIMLTNLTNTILMSDSLPDELGKSEMVYFHKKGDPTDLANFRGIALQSVLYKIAAAFTAKQVLGACDNLDLLSRAQVAARKHGRAGDHVAVMTTAIADAERTKRELHIVTCDIRKAFDDVPREALQEALALHGFPAETVRRVKMLQSCSGTTVRTRYGRSPTPVITRRGCKQGCPLSPITYCLFMDMLITSMQADPACEAYDQRPADGLAAGQAPEPPASGTGLQCQAYMDDLALFAPSAPAAQAQLSLAHSFLNAYGMAFNRAKCQHTCINGAQSDTLHLGSPTSTVPRTSPGDTIEYLGHLIPLAGDWSAQEAKTQKSLAEAALQVSYASAHKACHTLWVAAFTQHDAVSVLHYYMGATGFSDSFLSKARTTLAEPVRSRAFIGKHVGRINLFGPPARKGLGITDPMALDRATKVTTLFRLLNTAQPVGVGALAARAWAAVGAAARKAGATVPALYTGAARGLRARPRGEPLLHIVRSYADLGATPLGDLVPALRHNPGKAWTALASMRADAALNIAAPSPSAGPGAPLLSPAEEAILAGTAGTLANSLWADQQQQTGATLEVLLTQEGLDAAKTLKEKGKQSLANTLATALHALLTSAHNFTFVARHTDRVHAAHHAPHSNARPTLTSPHVGVDGSCVTLPDGSPSAAGAAVYYTHAAGQPDEQVAHIVTCTFTGEQTSTNAECSACTLALQTLAHASALVVGWDHLNAVTHVHQQLPTTAPAPIAGGEEAAPRPPTAHTLEHYAGNPHLTRASALIARDHAAGKTRQVIHTRAHALRARPGADPNTCRERMAHTILSAQNSTTWDAQLRAIVVPSATLQQVTTLVCAALGGGACATDDIVIRTTQNTLADWAAGRATAPGSASTALSPNWLSPYAWTLVDDRGAIQHADSKSIADLVCSRVSRHCEQEDLHPDANAALPIRLCVDCIWGAESTRVVTKPSRLARGSPGEGLGRGQPSLPVEHLTKHYCQMQYGSIRYNQEAAVKDPELLSTTLQPKRAPGRRAGRARSSGASAPNPPVLFSTACPLCKAAGADTRDHLFNACPATLPLRNELHAELVARIGGKIYGDWAAPVAQRVADAVLLRRDWFAGQISLEALDILREAKSGAPGSRPSEASVPATGRIQSAALEYSLKIHKKRMEAVPKGLSLTEYRKAMWAGQKTKRAARAPVGGSATGLTGSAPPVSPALALALAIATPPPAHLIGPAARPSGATAVGIPAPVPGAGGSAGPPIAGRGSRASSRRATTSALS